MSEEDKDQEKLLQIWHWVGEKVLIPIIVAGVSAVGIIIAAEKTGFFTIEAVKMSRNKSHL